MMTADRLRRIVSSGNAAIGVCRDMRRPDRMRAVLVLTDNLGQRWEVRMSPGELRAVLTDALTLLSADEKTVAGWWKRLTDENTFPGSTERSTAASDGCCA